MLLLLGNGSLEKRDLIEVDHEWDDFKDVNCCRVSQRRAQNRK